MGERTPLLMISVQSTWRECEIPYPFLEGKNWMSRLQWLGMCEAGVGCITASLRDYRREMIQIRRDASCGNFEKEVRPEYSAEIIGSICPSPGSITHGGRSSTWYRPSELHGRHG